MNENFDAFDEYAMKYDFDNHTHDNLYPLKTDLTASLSTKQIILNDKVISRVIKNIDDWKTICQEIVINNSGKTSEEILSLVEEEGEKSIATVKFVSDVTEQNLINKVYPIGAVYQTSDSTNPSTTFGQGTWKLFKQEDISIESTSYTLYSYLRIS